MVADHVAPSFSPDTRPSGGWAAGLPHFLLLSNGGASCTPTTSGGTWGGWPSSPSSPSPSMSWPSPPRVLGKSDQLEHLHHPAFQPAGHLGIKSRKWWWFVVGVLAINLLNADYANTGVILTLIFYLCRNKPWLGALIYVLSYIRRPVGREPGGPSGPGGGGHAVGFEIFALLAAPLSSCPPMWSPRSPNGSSTSSTRATCSSSSWCGRFQGVTERRTAAVHWTAAVLYLIRPSVRTGAPIPTPSVPLGHLP